MRERIVQRYRITAVERTFQVLELLGSKQSRNGWSVAEVASTTGIAKSTVFGLLATLEQLGYANYDEKSERYQLSLKLFAISSQLVAGLNVVEVSLEPLRVLVERSGETANLGVLQDDQCIYLLALEGPGPLRAATWAGKKAHMHCTALGKVLLSACSSEQVVSLFAKDGMPRLTEHTITSIDGLLEELARVRRIGYALEIEEEVIGLGCVGAPVRNHLGEVVAAVSMTAPVLRLQPSQRHEQIQLVCETALAISHRLGYFEPVALDSERRD